METPFNLATALATWRQFQARRQPMLEEDLDELEVHLRAHLSDLRRQGWGEEAAFREAVRALGDLEEAEAEYSRVYWGKLRRRQQLLTELQWRLSMFSNYVKIALRDLRRHKGYSFITIAGLSLGMACCLLLFQYVAFETSFDQFNTKKDRLYRATFEYTRGEGMEGISSSSVLAFGPIVAQEVPGIVRYTRILPTYGGVVLSNQGASETRTFTENHALFVDTTFFSMFDYPLVKGDRSQVLSNPHTMLISESMARKYFGDQEPLGKTLELSWWESGTYTIAGVMEDVPPTSHLRFDFLFPLSDLLDNEAFLADGGSWGPES